MAQQAVLDVFRLERFPQQGIVLEINHAQCQIVAGPPKGVGLGQFLGVQRHAGHRGARRAKAADAGKIWMVEGLSRHECPPGGCMSSLLGKTTCLTGVLSHPDSCMARSISCAGNSAPGRGVPGFTRPGGIGACTIRIPRVTPVKPVGLPKWSHAVRRQAWGRRGSCLREQGIIVVKGGADRRLHRSSKVMPSRAG